MESHELRGDSYRLWHFFLGKNIFKIEVNYFLTNMQQLSVGVTSYATNQHVQWKIHVLQEII